MQKVSKLSITQGSLWKNILIFSVPLIFSNLLQVLFNMSDIAVVGRFSGPDALGSVGSCTILITLYTGLMIGMGSGINAISATYIGSGDNEKLTKTVNNAFIISVFYGLLVMLIGIISADSVLSALDTKSELMEGAKLYLKVYLLGMPALAVYNYGLGILSAAGDSKTPLYYLSAAGLINIGLNLLFVIAFNLSVLGVALASVISQYMSAVLVFFKIKFSHDNYTLVFKDFRLNPHVTKKILMLGIPAGMQNAIFAFANLFIQKAVNSFDTVMVQGNSAAANADALVYDVMAAFYVACSTFIAQNYGAGKKERILKSFRICIIYSFGIAALIGLGLFFFGIQFLSLFTTDPAVAEAGLIRLKLMAFCYCFSSFMDCAIAASRGLCKTVIPTITVIFGSCLLRILWVYTIFAYFGTIQSLYLLYIFSWTMTAVLELIYFFVVYKKQIKALKSTQIVPTKS